MSCNVFINFKFVRVNFKYRPVARENSGFLYEYVYQYIYDANTPPRINTPPLVNGRPPATPQQRDNSTRGNNAAEIAPVTPTQESNSRPRD